MIFLLGWILAVSAFSSNDQLLYREKTKNMFYHAFNSYMSHGFPLDEVKPLSCTPNTKIPDPLHHGVNDVLGGYPLTLIDSLDTLAVIGDQKNFHEGVRTLIETVQDFAYDSKVQVFETNIRVLGSLLSCHQILMNPKWNMTMDDYQNELLTLSIDLADRLLPAFTESTTEFPYPRVNLMGHVPPKETSNTCPAGIGTLLLEFGVLSRLTGNSTYETVAKNALLSLYDKRSSLNLFGSDIDILTKNWTSVYSGVGASIDSVFEYFLKSYVLFGDDDYLDMFQKTNEAVKKHVLVYEDMIYRVVNMTSGAWATYWTDSLSAFYPGLLTLSGDVQAAEHSVYLFFVLWRKYGGLPERFDLYMGTTALHYYPLRPELVESIYFIYQATKNPYYLSMGASMLDWLERECRSKCGYATVQNVETNILDDRMETFFLSETLKYFYLLFDKDHHLHKTDSNIVFTTEAHLLELPYQKQTRKVNENTKHLTCPNQAKQTLFLPSLPMDIHRIYYLYDLTRWDPMEDLFFTNYTLPSYWAFASMYPQKAICSKDSTLVRFLPTSIKSQVRGSSKVSNQTLKVKQKGKHFWVNRISNFTLTLDRAVRGTGNYKIDGFEVVKMGNYYVERGGMIHVPASSIQMDADSLMTSDYCIASIWVNQTFGREMGGMFARYGPMVKWSEYFKASLVLASHVDKKNEFGCEPFSWSQKRLIEGKILVVPRGKCMFSTKTRHAEEGGSVGIIVVNHHEDTLTMIPETQNDIVNIRIPSIMMSSSDMNRLATLANEGTLVSLSGRNCPQEDNQPMIQIAKAPIFNIKLLGQEKKMDLFDCRMNSLLDKGQDLTCMIQCPTDSNTCCAH